MSDTPILDNLCTPATRPVDLRKGPSRLEQRMEAKPLTIVDDREFRRIVWDRDQHRCRKCQRKVVKVVTRQADRGEVHHLHGRRGWLRFEDRCAILVCLACHEQLTGRVNEKWIVVTTVAVWWVVAPDGQQERFIDGRQKLDFERVA